jgi:ribosomal protein S12 methylthiotransferase
MAEGKVLPYLDIPFQHASPERAARHEAPRQYRQDAGAHQSLARHGCPDFAIRSTFIVGFPGETEADFELLLDWLKEAKLDRVGAFKYEPVKGAPANELGPRARAAGGSGAAVDRASWRRSTPISARILRRPSSASACR